MAASKKQSVVLILLMVASAVAWVLKERPFDKLGKPAGGFEVIEGCTLKKHRSNDGDSFHVSLPGGKEKELRLYFTDAPESGVRKYSNGDTNEERLGYQGDYFGGLSESQTVKIGQEAKKWVADQLGRGAFTVYTRWEQVYDGPRSYAMVQLDRPGGERWLHELLVEEGLARIYTQGTLLPDGTPAATQLGKLKGLEKDAKRAGKGAWGLSRVPNRR